MKRLFVSYAHEEGFGYIIIDRALPPRNNDEIKLLQGAIEKLHKTNKPIITNWIVMEE